MWWVYPDVGPLDERQMFVFLVGYTVVQDQKWFWKFSCEYFMIRNKSVYPKQNSLYTWQNPLQDMMSVQICRTPYKCTFLLHGLYQSKFCNITKPMANPSYNMYIIVCIALGSSVSWIDNLQLTLFHAMMSLGHFSSDKFSNIFHWRSDSTIS